MKPTVNPVDTSKSPYAEVLALLAEYSHVGIRAGEVAEILGRKRNTTVHHLLCLAHWKHVLRYRGKEDCHDILWLRIEDAATIPPGRIVHKRRVDAGKPRAPRMTRDQHDERKQQIVEALRKHDRLKTSELVQMTGIPPTTIEAYMTALKKQRLIASLRVGMSACWVMVDKFRDFHQELKDASRNRENELRRLREQRQRERELRAIQADDELSSITCEFERPMVQRVVPAGAAPKLSFAPSARSVFDWAEAA